MQFLVILIIIPNDFVTVVQLCRKSKIKKRVIELATNVLAITNLDTNRNLSIFYIRYT